MVFFYKGEERYNIVFGGEIRLRANGRNNRLCIDGNYLVKKKNLRIKKREVIWSSVFEWWRIDRVLFIERFWLGLWVVYLWKEKVSRICG